MRYLLLAAILLLTSCSAGGSPLARDLRAADGSCSGRAWPSKAAMVACLRENETAVWAQDEPGTLDLYEAFAARRDALAQDYDRGLMSEADYRSKLDTLKAEALAQLDERRASGLR